jgi:hypothetical protein
MQLVSSFLKPGTVVNFEFSLVKILIHPKKKKKRKKKKLLLSILGTPKGYHVSMLRIGKPIESSVLVFF